MTISSQIDDSGTSKCIECGASISPNANFCGECGASQAKQAAQADFYPSNYVCHDGMTMNLDLEHAIERWLAAREQCSCGCCQEKLEPSTNATNMLYAAFSEDCQGDERTMPEAFEQFRKALVEDGDWYYRHLGVSVLCPPKDIT